MRLEAGLTLRVAPRFHIPTDWRERIEVHSGLLEEGAAPRSQSDWRRPSEDELALLSGETPGGDWDGEVLLLIAIPEHLRARWWAAAGREDGGVEDVEEFLRATREFLQYKGLPLPEDAAFDVAIQPPGRSLTRWCDPPGGRGGGSTGRGD